MSQQISVFVHDMNTEVQTVVVDAMDSVRVLDSYIKEAGTKYLLYQDQLLNVSFSFGYFGIGHGSHIYVLRPTPMIHKRSQAERCERRRKQIELHNQEKMMAAEATASSLPQFGKIDFSFLNEASRLMDMNTIRNDHLAKSPSRRDISQALGYITRLSDPKYINSSNSSLARKMGLPASWKKMTEKKG